MWTTPETITETPPKRSRVPRIVLLFLGTLIVSAGILFILSRAPSEFERGTIVDIPSGHTLREIALLFKERHIVKSPMLLMFLIRLTESDTRIASGAYLFEEPPTVFDVARRLSARAHGIDSVRITLPEGITVNEMSGIFDAALPNFDATAFLASAGRMEGYLFPDTYFFFSTATSGPVIETLRQTFDIKTRERKVRAIESGRRWDDIIIMASLLEEEAITEEDRRIIAGILWRRPDVGMRLQVDATLRYVLGKTSAELSLDDLNHPSPYNTYRYDGLPPGPIANPGLGSIDAALDPKASSYLYYLSDSDGTIHYAKTFEEHKLNKAKYLR